MLHLSPELHPQPKLQARLLQFIQYIEYIMKWMVVRLHSRK